MAIESKIYCFDIDGTLCTNTDGKYEEAHPFPHMIAKLNVLHDAGQRILLFTARGSTTGIDWRELTERQLAAWGVKYHELQFGKPFAHVFIDDRGMSLGEWDRNPPPDISHLLLSCAKEPVETPPVETPLISRSQYLDVTYSTAVAPYGPYPAQLASHIHDTIFKGSGRLLDLGCGRGEFLSAFADLGHQVSGADASPRSAALAAPHHVAVCHFDRESLPFPKNSFDFLFSKSVVEHTRDPVGMLSKAVDTLRPGGLAVIMTPSWVHTHGGPFYIDHTHVTPFTAPSLADVMQFAGLEAVDVKYFYQLPFLWRRPQLAPLARLLALLPLPYRPMDAKAPWSDDINKLIRFSKELMLLGVGRKPFAKEGPL